MIRLISHFARLCGVVVLAPVVSCLLPATASAQGRIIGWGSDQFGGISDIPSGSDFIQIVSGEYHHLARRVDGSLVSWGRDSNGLVANTPPGLGFISIAAGADNSMALRSDGSIVTWGRDFYGQVSTTPTGTGYTQISVHNRNGLALHSNGTLVSWGDDALGQITDTPTGIDFKQISQGSIHAMALRNNGSVVSWGSDSYSVVSNSPPGTGFAQVAAVQSWSMVRLDDGSVMGWGINGPGDPVYSGAPNDTGFVELATGGYHGIVRRVDGSVAAFGWDWADSVSSTPPGGGLISLAAGPRNFFALTTNRTGDSYCYSDANLNCPCIAGHPGEGCANSSFESHGGQLMCGGNASIIDDSFALHVRKLPPFKVGLCVKGSAQLGGGSGIALGDGVLCTAAQKRSQVISSSAVGLVSMDNWRGQPFGSYPGVANVGTATQYQWWYRDPSFHCSGLGFNFTNAWEVTWTP